ncbi:MAG: four helix bundle protein [Oscillospiraceae bacterium]|nr:four helix bundle protein [Oscillospiraceae bacterium]
MFLPIKVLNFAVKVVNLYKFLAESKKEFILSKQILKSGTSIGANISEAQRAQSKADFISKMSIALKEANETEYWLRLLYETQYISKTQFENLHNDLSEIIKILMAICKTSNQNK